MSKEDEEKTKQLKQILDECIADLQRTIGAITAKLRRLSEEK